MSKKIALVTGGSKGIGFETVRRFVALGYKVVTCARNKSTWADNLANYPDLSAVDFQKIDINIDAEVSSFLNT